MGHKIAKTAIATAMISIVTPHAAAQLEEVVVTAQKRSETMQDIPVAVSAIGGADIEALGWENASDVAAQVPNMQMSAPTVTCNRCSPFAVFPWSTTLPPSPARLAYT